MYHLGRTLKVYRDKKATQATLEMWDDNIITCEVSSAIAKNMAEGSYALVDYSPIPGFSMPVPQQVVVKVLGSKEGSEAWNIYRSKFEKLHAQTKTDNPTGHLSYR